MMQQSGIYTMVYTHGVRDDFDSVHKLLGSAALSVTPSHGQLSECLKHGADTNANVFGTFTRAIFEDTLKITKRSDVCTCLARRICTIVVRCRQYNVCIRRSALIIPFNAGDRRNKIEERSKGMCELLLPYEADKRIPTASAAIISSIDDDESK